MNNEDNVYDSMDDALALLGLLSTLTEHQDSEVEDRASQILNAVDEDELRALSITLASIALGFADALTDGDTRAMLESMSMSRDEVLAEPKP